MTLNTQEEKIITAYADYLHESGLADKTIVSYLSDIRLYKRYLNELGGLLDASLNRHQVSLYKKKLLSENKRPATINKAINSLYCYNQYLRTLDSTMSLVVNISRDKIRVATGSEKQVDVFTDAEVQELLTYLASDEVTQRDRLMVYLLLYTGVRVSELVAIRIADVDLMGRQLKVIGKGGKYREIPLREDLVVLVKDYLMGERSKSKYVESDHLLLSQRGQMQADAVNKRLNSMGQHLGISMYPHKFRHSLCTSLLRKGVDIVTVAKITGHANVNTTARYYVNVSKQEKQQAVDLL